MANRTSTAFRSLARIVSAFGAAAEASAAVRNHRRPSDRSLEALGIDPDHFPEANTF